MIRKRKILAYSLSGTLLLSTSGIANAACALSGTWHFFAMMGSTPDIQSFTTTVRNSTNTGTVNVKGFPLAGAAFKNDTSRVIKCVLTVAANGSFTGPCDSYGAAGAFTNPPVSGNLALSSCDLTGTINVQGDPTPVKIRGGHINGVSGAGMATQGSKRVLSFTLVKN
jgi:hypothetical protein